MSNHYYTLNLHSNIPPSWQPTNIVNKKILENSDITSNWKYRQYVQKNANQIMKFNTMESIYASGNNPYVVENKQSAENVPYLYKTCFEQNKPKYGYSNSDLKKSYISKQQLAARMIAPTININR